MERIQKNLITVYTLTDHAQKQEVREKIISEGKALDNFACSLLANPIIKRELEKPKPLQIIKMTELGGYLAIKDRLQQGSHTQQDLLVVLQQINQRAQSHQRSLSQKQHQGRTQ
jgi:hypothetical protein